MSEKIKLPQHANNRELRVMVQAEKSRADEWKAMAGRLAGVITQSIEHIDDGSREICLALNDGRIACELSNRDIAELLKAIKAFDALLAKEKGAG
jgi:ribosomal protein L1